MKQQLSNKMADQLFLSRHSICVNFSTLEVQNNQNGRLSLQRFLFDFHASHHDEHTNRISCISNALVPDISSNFLSPKRNATFELKPHRKAETPSLKMLRLHSEVQKFPSLKHVLIGVTQTCFFMNTFQVVGGGGFILFF